MVGNITNAVNSMLLGSSGGTNMLSAGPVASLVQSSLSSKQPALPNINVTNASGQEVDLETFVASSLNLNSDAGLFASLNSGSGVNNLLSVAYGTGGGVNDILSASFGTEGSSLDLLV